MKSQGVSYFRGSEDNVLERFYEGAQHFQASTIVRITADCPLMDPLLIDEMLAEFFSENRFDYFSNTLERSYPRGMDIEIFSFRALEDAFKQAVNPYEKEHVTPYIYQHPDNYRLGSKRFSEDCSRWRWTVDTQEDFTLVASLLAFLYPQKPFFSLNDLIDCMQAHPSWENINSHIA